MTKGNKTSGCPSCALHKLYRFIEPQILLFLSRNESAYGYQLIEILNAHPLSDGKIDHSAIYRTLRALEFHGNVNSTWDTDAAGPAKRKYKITANGKHHLQEWLEAMSKMKDGLNQFIDEASS